MDTQQIRAAARATFQAQLAAGQVPPIPVSAYGAISLMRIKTKRTPAKARRTAQHSTAA